MSIGQGTSTRPNHTSSRGWWPRLQAAACAAVADLRGFFAQYADLSLKSELGIWPVPLASVGGVLIWADVLPVSGFGKLVGCRAGKYINAARGRADGYLPHHLAYRE